MDEALRIAVLQRQLDGVAEEMGAVLVRSATSANIKERQDSSCALFAADGTLLAQAAHIPVHLGSMQHAVDAVLAAGAGPGETWILNDPYAGGTHLPDITLVTPIAAEDGAPVAVAAVRAHHADVGGDTPGSMRPDATDIAQEGVRIEPRCVGGVDGLDAQAVDALVERMRQPAERRADLRAQAAALAVARRRLPAIVAARSGRSGFHAECSLLLGYGHARALAAVHRVPAGEAAGEQLVELPGGGTAVVVVHLRAGEGRLEVDLRGSAPQTPSSLNCPRAVTVAAVQFVVRSVLDPGLPTAGGIDEVVDVLTEPGTIVHAVEPAAVAGGNVEVSSVVVDAVLAALAGLIEVPADGQGTMNNLVLGSDGYSYYETIAGGQGASSRMPGASAVHVAMTNTRNTPIEVLELEFPLEVERVAVRRGSGGAGRNAGGDGVVRAVRVLEPSTLSLLGQRRLHPPRGREGGEDGAPGEQLVNGEPVPGCTTIELEAGDVVEVRTPGGGGYGAATTARDPAREAGGATSSAG